MNIFTTILIQPLANGLVLFYKILGNNMGLAIIGFSLTLVLALRPLTKQYLESMKKMKEYGPQLEKLKNKHKGDKEKLMKAQADFYKEKGINPGAGCLPMILQLVVMFALLQVFLNALTSTNPAKLNALMYEPLKFGKDAVINTRFLYLDITKPDTFKIPGIPFALPGIILILAAISQMISAKITSPYLEAEEKAAKKTPGAGDDFAAAMQTSAIYTFPLMTLLIGGRFPAGVAIYWVTFSIYQTVQQYRSTGLGGLKTWIKLLPVVKSGNGKGNKKSSS
jgi:YidC/Oxa1 family membrane protein insertase